MFSKTLLVLAAIAMVQRAEAELTHKAQQRDLPSDWDDPDDLSIVGPDDKGMMTGLLSAPNDEDVEFLRKQAEAATKYREHLEEESKLSPSDATPECVACKDKSKKGAETDAEVAKQQLGQVKKWVELEQKREELLPKLVKELHKKAVKEHKAHMKAEEKLEKAVAAEKMDPCVCVSKTCKDGYFKPKLEDHKSDNYGKWCFTHGDCQGAGRKSDLYCTGNFWATEKQGAIVSENAPAFFENLLHSVARERFVDRLSALERKRVAECAVMAADEQYRKTHKVTLKTTGPVADIPVKVVKCGESVKPA